MSGFLDRIKDRATREWYLRAALEYGWSQDVLVLQIKGSRQKNVWSAVELQGKSEGRETCLRKCIRPFIGG